MGKGKIPALLLLAAAVTPGRLLSQSITVVEAPGFHARPVHQHQFSFTVAVDTGAGGAVLGTAALGAFTFAGTVRLDAAAPFARAPENPGYADTARFDADGRVMLLVADSAAHGPIRLEPRGIAGANAGRLLIGASGWPLNRVLLITIDPLDLFVTATHAGFTDRDSVRIDTDRGVAYVTDAAAAPAVIAIGLGRGAHGRLQTEQTTVLLERNFDGQVGRERRTVNRLVLIVEPDRGDDGEMHAEINFGLGRSEAEALAAATAADPGAPAVTRLAVLTMPNDEVNLALAQLAGAAAWLDGPPSATPDTSVLGGLDLWRQVQGRAHEDVGASYGRMDDPARELATMRYMVIRQLFGVRDEEGQVGIAPHIDGAADDFTWRLAGYRTGSDTLGYSYRPADRRLQITIGAFHRVRLHVTLPWMTATSCVEARRGNDPPEHPQVVQLADGSFYFDLRAAWDPANVTVSAAACGS